MNNDKFNSSLNALLDEGRINHVIEVLKNKCQASVTKFQSLHRLIRELARIEDTYSHLRQFLIDGNPDPMRTEIYETLKQQLRDLGRDYLFIINGERYDSFFMEYTAQTLRNYPVSYYIDELKKTDYRIQMASETEADPQPFVYRREYVVDGLFRRIWTLPPWVEDERKDIVRLLVDEDISFDVKSQIISALLLGLLKFNDPNKFLLLLNAYDEFSDERLQARALTSIILVLSRWGHSALSSKEVKQALLNLADSILTYARVREIVMTLIRTRDTDRVSREVTEAFNSTMKEITPEMLEKLQREGMSVDSTETGMNPEWEKLMKNKELEERMQAINDMQLEGMDVMMQTFARLKHFGFFNYTSNWFLPFSTSHSSVAPLFKSFNEDGFTIMADATDMCASDRFSFALGVLQMPEERRNVLAMSFGSQMEALSDMMKDRENVKKRSAFDTEVLVFARDLYRFAKLFPKRKDFFDPFDQPLDFLHVPLLQSLLDGDEIITTAADFYFEHGYYPLALSLYEEAASSGEANRQLFEKIGYAYQMQSDYAKALENYEKADLFSSDADRSSTWLVKKLALTNKALGHYSKAADYYRRLLDSDPENLKIEFHLATVLLRAGKIAEAREIISKIHYLEPDHVICSRIHIRLKGHDAFLENNYKDALTLYEKARGEQSAPEYHRDLIAEISMMNPLVDISTLKILLDIPSEE